MDMKRLVVILDGSHGAQSAAQWCVEHAGPDTAVIGVTAVSPWGAGARTAAVGIA
jgi:hypothetical protein